MDSKLSVTVIALAGLLVGCFDDPAVMGETEATDSSSGASTESVGTSTSSGTTTVTTTPTTATSSTASTETSPSGSSSSTSSADETGAGICPDVGEPCTICESTQCPEAYCDCFNNGSCVLLAQCNAACNIADAGCFQACWALYPEGISDGAVLTDCAATTCNDECGGLFTPLNDCQLCLYGECSDAMNTCVANPQCFALLACLDTCDDVGCENTCYAVYPDGLADSGPVGQCAQDACLRVCS